MLRTFTATIVALIGFAANSIICRLALETESIGASSFTALRLFAGALTLVIILSTRKDPTLRYGKGRWLSAIMLFAYAAAFSFAYNSLNAGTGALILFAAVQITMVLADYVMGNRLSPAEWGGLLCAFSGFVVLILPGVSAPPLVGTLLMVIAGCAWGIYTLIGKKSKNSLVDTTGNFVKSLPFAALLLLAGIPHLEISPYGILLAIISGSLTTGVIYVVWYVALEGLSIVLSAVVQLLVPVITAFGGVLFLAEIISTRLVLSTFMIMGGILAVVLVRNKPAKV